MSTSPYQAPRSTAVDRGSEPASATKAVLIALAVDLGGTMVIGTVMAVVYASLLLSGGMDPEQIVAALENIPPTSLLSLVGMAGGALVSLVAGFVCARLSQRRDYRLGVIVAGIAGAAGFALGYQSYPPAMNAAMVVLTAAAILLGMKLGMPKADQAAA